MRRSHLQPDLDGGCAHGFVEIIGLKTRKGQRGAADVKRERGKAGENPQPAERSLFVIELGHPDISVAQGFVSAGARASPRPALSGYPASAPRFLFHDAPAP